MKHLAVIDTDGDLNIDLGEKYDGFDTLWFIDEDLYLSFTDYEEFINGFISSMQNTSIGILINVLPSKPPKRESVIAFNGNYSITITPKMEESDIMTFLNVYKNIKNANEIN